MDISSENDHFYELKDVTQTDVEQAMEVATADANDGPSI